MKYLYLLLIFVGFAACSSDDEKLPDNVIKSSNGIEITLEWSTGGSSTQAQSDADLDLYLIRGVDAIDTSDGSVFEQVKIEDFYADGDYFIEVEYFDGAVAVDYSIFLNGVGSTENLVYESSFLATDKGVVVSYLKINKAGDTYTITDL